MAATLWLLLGTATACPGYSSGPGKDSTLALWPPAHRGLPVGQGMRGEGGVSREPGLTAGLWQPSFLGSHTYWTAPGRVLQGILPSLGHLPLVLS